MNFLVSGLIVCGIIGVVIKFLQNELVRQAEIMQNKETNKNEQ